MTWGMTLKLYAGKEEKSIEIAKYKIKNSERLEKILARFLEEQKEQLEEETREGKGWGIEIKIVDENKREISLKNLHELIYEQEELKKTFIMTTRAVGKILTEGIS
ncbi:hypothetical protein ES705_26982 [subsurface metagenome]